ncbi:alpha-ketoglutarate-dependent dioxygenase AlkB family protein [Methylocystis heyeri]|uniref:alpha-ketoglutarate-dependent dioxygenase AlkB family protein n=1 Tax=Methylocystis heyeri TaxID=391905 RepID=UPI00113CE5AA|nr:alpha-ketoglutarate-dependent dioxygenase AlkB [Methylocystis heyeri]
MVLRRGFLDAAAQEALAREIREIVTRAPLFVSVMPKTGAPMSVRMTNCGSLGWMSDKERGYRYEPRHPVTGEPWPAIPKVLLDAWGMLADCPAPPEACLINAYGPEARMGLHQDRDEKELSAPIVSFSLGADCLFRIGGLKRGGATVPLVLSSGDVLILGGEARMRHHGVDRILPTLAPPNVLQLPAGAVRVNLTLRRVNGA